MKRLIVIMTLAATLLTGCCTNQIDERTYDESGQFVYVNTQALKGTWVTVYYDRDTKVMYIVSSGDIEVMLNTDGTPKLYEDGE